MNTELTTDFFLQRLLTRADKRRLFVEVGLGSCDWSFGWARKEGFPCVAVEPLPVAALREACRRQDVTLIEAAVGREPGVAHIYHGELNGSGLPDTSSLCSDWWAVGEKRSEVRIMKLTNVLQELRASEVACLKVDVEGMESDVLLGLKDLPDEALPEVVAFEYGGGGVRSTGEGGWGPDGLRSTATCLQVLRSLGYRWGLTCERTLTIPAPFTLDGGGSFELPLPTHAEVGNILMTRRSFEHHLSGWMPSYRRLSLQDSARGVLRQWSNEIRFRIRRYAGGFSRLFRAASNRIV